MQNINSTTTTASSFDARETERPTLAELMNARAEERRQQDIARAQLQQQQREQERREALDYVATWALSHISDALRAALRINYAVDDNRLDEGDDDNCYAFARAGYATIDVADCGIDDCDDARSDANRDERWRIHHEHYISACRWAICGPHGYRAYLDAYQPDYNVDADLLDALAAYPAWLIGEQEKRNVAQRNA